MAKVAKLVEIVVGERGLEQDDGGARAAAAAAEAAGLGDLVESGGSGQDRDPPDGGTDPSVQPVTGGGQQGAPAEGMEHSTGAGAEELNPMETGEMRRRRFREQVAAEKKRREDQAAEVERATRDAMAAEGWQDLLAWGQARL